MDSGGPLEHLGVLLYNRNNAAETAAEEQKRTEGAYMQERADRMEDTGSRDVARAAVMLSLIHI